VRTLRTNFITIHEDANVNEKAFIGDYTVIGRGVSIEKEVYISSGVKIYGKTTVKSGTYIGENCIIGHPQRNDLKNIINKMKSVADFEGPEVIIGKNCTIRAGTIIYSDVIIGEFCQTGHNAMIREKTKIGEHCVIGTACIIDGTVEIGRNSSIQTGAYIPLHSKIGESVFMGPYSKLTNDKYMYRKQFDLIGPTLGDFTSLGANSVIMPGVELAKSTIVGAGSVVTKDTDEKDIVAGNPAKLLKKIPEDWENQLK
jgi:acetyltransferase-like isoleucine patch superfamily enzyme